MYFLQLHPFLFTYDELLGKTRSLLLPFCAIIPAPVAGITSIGPDLYTGSLTLITYRTIAFYMWGLLFLVHGN
jgi:hypothetical protein